MLGAIAGVRPAPAQTTLSVDSVRAILRGAALASAMVDQLNAEDRPVQQSARNLIAELQIHNDSQCQYQDGHPEQCANYAAEQGSLADRSRLIQQQLLAIDKPRRAARLHFDSLMTVLRTGHYAAALARQQTALVACASRLELADEETCLTQVRLPPR
jgi:hypothetical protein